MAPIVNNLNSNAGLVDSRKKSFIVRVYACVNSHRLTLSLVNNDVQWASDAERVQTKMHKVNERVRGAYVRALTQPTTVSLKSSSCTIFSE